MSLKRKIEVWGVKHLGTSDVKTVLTELYETQNKTIADIARMFDSTAPGVRWFLEKEQVTIRLRSVSLLLKVRKLGYKSVDHYFDRNSGEKMLKEMATELEVSAPTVTRYYKLFLARRENKAAGKQKAVA